MRMIRECFRCGQQFSFVRLGGLVLPGTDPDPLICETCGDASTDNDDRSDPEPREFYRRIVRSAESHGDCVGGVCLDTSHPDCDATFRFDNEIMHLQASPGGTFLLTLADGSDDDCDGAP